MVTQKKIQSPKTEKISGSDAFERPSIGGLPLFTDELSANPYFQLLFESTPNPYLVLRPDTPKFTIVAVTDSYLAATNTQRSAILGRGLFEVFPDNPNDASASGVSDLHISLDRVIQERVQDVMGVQKYDIPLRGPDQSGFEVKYWSPVNTPVFDKLGELVFIIHRVEDVTEFILLREQSFQENSRIEKVQARADWMEAEVLKSSRELKEANRQLKASNEELECREKELTILNERLHELDRVKTSFFSSVSHEFRTPLTLMLGPIEDALQDANTIPENRERMDVAYRNALRLLKLVNNLLDFAQIEAGRTQATFQPTDLSTLTKELASMFNSATSKAKLSLTVDCQPLPELVYVDRDMWEKIVLNLLSNAFKHTFEGEIQVRLRWKQDHVELTLRDTGVGIPAEQLPYLFERFHRVPNARSRTHEGSGIGLALVSELVKLHSGKIDVDSEVDRGTTFMVSIPTGKAHLPAEQIAVETSPALPMLRTKPFVEEALRWLPQEIKGRLQMPDETLRWHKPDGSTIRVLLAEDNPDMRNYVFRLLEPYCEIETVSNGEEALVATQRQQPDLILSDIMMPKVDGFELLSLLKNNPSLKTIPLILLSARAGEDARVEGLQAGADDYLVKPFNARELLARVKSNLNLELHRARQVAEEAQQVSEERYKSLFNQAAAGIAQTDLSGKFLLVNQRYCEMVGRSQEELLGLRMQDITHPEDLQNNLQLFEQAVADGLPFTIEKRYLCSDGSHIWVRNHVSLIRDSHDVPQGILAISQDITDRKKAEMALEAAQESLTAYAAKLESSNKELEHFATIASHDLQEPLRKVIMFSEHLKSTNQDLLSDEGKDDIERMQRATRRMQSLIDDLLDLSRVTRRGKPFQRTDLAEVMKEVLTDLHFPIKESGGRVEISPMMTIEADPGQMQQLLECLIRNALKFHREGYPPVVKVSAKPFGSRFCQITVEDNGIGIKNEHQEKIFETFVRLHGQNAYPGTGIGLAIVKKIVERHQGTVEVHSVPGEGAVFKVTLPIRQQ
jgi:PAS domain S-box-containing protein